MQLWTEHSLCHFTVCRFCQFRYSRSIKLAGSLLGCNWSQTNFKSIFTLPMFLSSTVFPISTPPFLHITPPILPSTQEDHRNFMKIEYLNNKLTRKYITRALLLILIDGDDSFPFKYLDKLDNLWATSYSQFLIKLKHNKSEKMNCLESYKLLKLKIILLCNTSDCW